MIDFRFPYILLFYFALLLFLVIWMKGEKRHNEKIWKNINPVLKGKVFSRLDTNYLKWKNRLTVFGLIF